MTPSPRFPSLHPWLVTLAGLLIACGDGSDSSAGPGTPGEITTAQSSKKRASPAAPADDVTALAEGNTAFALDLYQSLRADSDDNLFFSPYSVSLALTMTWAGARGQTHADMAQVLRYGLPAERLHPAFNALDQALASRGDDVPDEAGSGFTLRVANSLWGQQGFGFEDAFLDLLAESYGAGMNLVDFVTSAEEARRLINGWVAEQTEDRIRDLLPEGAVHSLTRLVLTNAIYFNASWLHPFDPADTKDGRFTTLGGTRATVPMMHQSVRTVYAEGADYEAVELPYVGHGVSMVLVVPRAGRFAAFEDGLDAATLQRILGDLGDTRVTLTMPRFEFEARAALADVLEDLGMAVAFQPPGGDTGADFSGMSGRRDLFIRDVLHKAFVAVDEAGTEAAASTAVLGEVTSAPPSATLVVDRPFVFLVRDRETGTVLFLGRVVDPRG